MSSATPPTPPSREAGVEDATRRTRLANERTYLAWWRTGLASLAAAVGLGRVAPEVSKVTPWPYEVLGVAFGVLAIVFMWTGYRRATSVEAALDRGEFAPLGRNVPRLLTVCGGVLAVATIVVILFDR